MANEAIIVELLGNRGDPIRYTCEDSIGIAKGAILCFEDPRLVSGSSSVHVTGVYPVAGIAAAEKVANDGATTIAVHTNGIFDLKLNTDTCSAGNLVTVSGANMIGPLISGAAQFLNGVVLGKALEDGATTERIQVKVST